MVQKDIKIHNLEATLDYFIKLRSCQTTSFQGEFQKALVCVFCRGLTLMFSVSKKIPFTALKGSIYCYLLWASLKCISLESGLKEIASTCGILSVGDTIKRRGEKFCFGLLKLCSQFCECHTINASCTILWGVAASLFTVIAHKPHYFETYHGRQDCRSHP